MNGVADPVDTGVAANDLVHRVNHDHFVVFVDGILEKRGGGRFVGGIVRWMSAGRATFSRRVDRAQINGGKDVFFGLGLRA